jgi:hypothetical protein
MNSADMIRDVAAKHTRLEQRVTNDIRRCNVKPHETNGRSRVLVVSFRDSNTTQYDSLHKKYIYRITSSVDEVMHDVMHAGEPEVPQET